MTKLDKATSSWAKQSLNFLGYYFTCCASKTNINGVEALKKFVSRGHKSQRKEGSKISHEKVAKPNKNLRRTRRRLVETEQRRKK
jgi:hypothetical protein